MFTESSSEIKKCNMISQQGWTMEILQTGYTDIATSSNNLNVLLEYCRILMKYSYKYFKCNLILW